MPFNNENIIEAGSCKPAYRTNGHCENIKDMKFEISHF